MVERKAWGSRSLLLSAGDRVALRHAGAAHEVRMQIRREVTQALADALVAAKQPVVAHDRGNGDEQTERRHDERFTDGTGHLVDGRLAREGDRDQRVQNAPHRAEQTDERSRRTDGGEERETVAHLAVDGVDRTLQRHRDPLVEVDAVRQATFVVRRSTETVFSHGTEVVVLREAIHGFLKGARAPELLLDDLGTGLQTALVPELREDDVPGHGGHDQQDDQSAASNEVTLCPERLDAIRIFNLDGVSSSVLHDFLDYEKTKRRP